MQQKPYAPVDNGPANPLATRIMLAMTEHDLGLALALLKQQSMETGFPLDVCILSLEAAMHDQVNMIIMELMCEKLDDLSKNLN
jgi:hypothetical protein